MILLPGLEEADRLAARLEAIGNIHSDGRPILGLDCRDLLEIPSGHLSGGHADSRPYLDAAFFPFWEPFPDLIRWKNVLGI